MIQKLFLALILIFGCCSDMCTDNIRIGVITASNYVGDREVAWRIKIAGEKLGWTVIIDENSGSRIKKKTDLDWVISMLPHNNAFNPYCPNYQVVFHPFDYLNDARRLLPFYEKYDGYLLTINDRTSISEGLNEKNKEFFHIPFYPTVYDVPYCEVPLNNLVTMVAMWSDRLHDEKFRTLYRLLSDSGFTKFYGVQRNIDIIPDGYMGSIPFDGVSVINVLQQHGIVLIMHSSIHNHEEIPSARIFEAAAASTVIISDMNPFVKTHFGDSVFYIDTTDSAQNIYMQILEHMHNIYQNPIKAREMAKTAHEIFVTKFEMSNQLLQIKALNQEFLNKTSKKYKKSKRYKKNPIQ